MSDPIALWPRGQGCQSTPRGLLCRAAAAVGCSRVATAALGALLAVGLLASPAAAHTPHDDVRVIELSPDFPTDGIVFGVLQLSEDLVFARSFDGGRTWDQRGMPLLTGTPSAIRFSPDFTNDQTVFVATDRRGVWRSTDAGTSFTQIGVGLTTNKIADLAVSPDFANDASLVVATNVGVGMSVDGGDTWTVSHRGLLDPNVRTIVYATPSLIFTGHDTLHRSENSGFSWFPLETFAEEISSIAPSPGFATDSTLAVGVTEGGGVHVSTNGGADFNPSTNGLTDLDIHEVALASDGSLLCAAKTEGCFRSDGLFQPWVNKIDGVEPSSPLTADDFIGVKLAPDYASSNTAFLVTFQGLYRSDDRGERWRQRDTFPQTINRTLRVSPSYAQDGSLLLGNFGGGMLVWESPEADPGPEVQSSGPASGPAAGPASPPGVAPSGVGPGARLVRGDTRPGPSTVPTAPVAGWVSRSAAINDLSMFPGPLAVPLDYPASETLFYGHFGMWRSDDRGLTWNTLNLASTTQVVRGIAVSPDFTNDRVVFHGTASEGIWRSTNAGDSWAQVTVGLPKGGISVRRFAFSADWANDQTLFVATRSKGLWRSIDGGTSWTEMTNGVTTGSFRELAIAPDDLGADHVFAGAVNQGLFITADGGDSWTRTNLGLPGEPILTIQGIAISPEFLSDSTVLVSTDNYGLFRSVDGGQSWTPINTGLTPELPRTMAMSPAFADDRTVFVSTHDWIWRSRDAGDTWQKLPGWVRVPDTHPQLFYTGTWDTASQSGCHGVGVTASANPGDQFELELHGDRVTWYATRSPTSGLAEVWLDGVLVETVDLYAPTVQPQQAVWSATFRGVTNHDVRVVVTGLSHPSASDAFVKSDGFSYGF